MISTKKSNEVRLCDRLAVSSSELPDLLGCGRFIAQEIGMKANARITVGRRVLWNVGKIKTYLDSQAEQGEC